jgi:DNA-binding HxlR family transcriptional regulator
MKRKPPSAFDSVSLQIMEHLLENGSTSAMKLTYIVNWRIIDEHLESLVEDGILERTYTTKGHRTAMYDLTEKGRICAILAEVEQNVYRGSVIINDSEFEESFSRIRRFANNKADDGAE